MPHQCLKCGRVFEEGSSQLLKGCPECNGNRFFFTKEPLTESERIAKEEDVGQDINTVLMDMIEEHSPELVDKSGKWVKLKPKDIRQAMQKHLPDKKIKPDKKENIDIITQDEYRKASIEKIESEMDEPSAPETIDIEKPGKYKIDLKGLLEEEPIIIQKDGTYTIHLPSVFKMLDKKE